MAETLYQIKPSPAKDKPLLDKKHKQAYLIDIAV